MASPTDGNCKPRPRALLWRLRRLPELSQSCRRRDRDKYRQRSSRSSARDTARCCRGTTVGMTQSQTLDWWTGENKYEIKLFANGQLDHWKQTANTFYSLHVNASFLFLLSTSDSLARLRLFAVCHFPYIIKEKGSITSKDARNECAWKEAGSAKKRNQ